MNVAEISIIRQETPTVKSFRLTLLDGVSSFLPGQWVDLYIEDPMARPEVIVGGFSITSSPLHKEYIEIAVKRNPEGRASVYMHEHIEVGDVVIVDGGYGDFYYREGMDDNLVLIAGGIGITPLMSIIRFIDEADLDVGATLCYSARTPSELVFRKELEAIAGRKENVRCSFAVTHPGMETWTGATGRIDRRMLSETCRDRDPLCYICGPRGFVEDIGKILIGLGVDPARVRHETW